MKKIFFFDIDGTLAIHGHIPDSNLKALEKLKEKGYLTFICTGRAPFYAQKLFGDLVDGIICCNGRYMMCHGKMIHCEKLTNEELQFYQDKIDSLKAGAIFVSDEKSYAYCLTSQQIEQVQHEYGIQRIEQYINNKDFYTFDLFYKNLQQRDELIALFKQHLIINDHGGIGHADCSTISFDKGHAIAYLLKYFDIDKDNAYAFGDGYNDQAMFREVGHSIAMGNAVDVLKEKATYVTNSIENDGIMKALIHENVL